MGCGCKGKKTPEPIKTPNSVTITENKGNMTKEQLELLEKLKKLNGGK